MMNRPSWDEYFMSIAELVSTRSTCLKHQTGALLVRDKRILTTGYNGAPRGVEHCLSRGCLRDELGIPQGQQLEICRGLHAAQNAIIQGALFGVSTRDSTLYTTSFPCIICLKLLVSAGVKKIVLKVPLPAPETDELRLAFDLIRQTGIEIIQLK